MKMTPENDGTSARRLLVRDCWEDRRRSLFLLSFDVSIANSEPVTKSAEFEGYRRLLADDPVNIEASRGINLLRC